MRNNIVILPPPSFQKSWNGDLSMKFEGVWEQEDVVKFKIEQVIITDDDGYLALKSLLPEGSIKWSRQVNDMVAVSLKDEISLDYIEKTFNSIHRTLRL